MRKLRNICIYLRRGAHKTFKSRTAAGRGGQRRKKKAC
nr:MAG TPA: hypothetical protein [Inoviridae sp.]